MQHQLQSSASAGTVRMFTHIFLAFTAH